MEVKVFVCRLLIKPGGIQVSGALPKKISSIFVFIDIFSMRPNLEYQSITIAAAAYVSGLNDPDDYMLVYPELLSG